MICPSWAVACVRWEIACLIDLLRLAARGSALEFASDGVGQFTLFDCPHGIPMTSIDTTSINSLQQGSLPKSAIEQRLWVCAREAAGDMQAEFSAPCAANVRDFIRAGVKNMERFGRLGEWDLEEAEKNLTTLVKGMAQAPMGVESRRHGMEKGVTLLREGSLVIAKRLCPLWPFA